MYDASHLHVLDLVPVFVPVYSFVLSFGDLDMPVETVFFVLALFFVIATYFFTVCAMLDTVNIVSLEILCFAL